MSSFRSLGSLGSLASTSIRSFARPSRNTPSQLVTATCGVKIRDLEPQTFPQPGMVRDLVNQFSTSALNGRFQNRLLQEPTNVPDNENDIAGNHDHTNSTSSISLSHTSEATQPSPSSKRNAGHLNIRLQLQSEMVKNSKEIDLLIEKIGRLSEVKGHNAPTNLVNTPPDTRTVTSREKARRVLEDQEAHIQKLNSQLTDLINEKPFKKPIPPTLAPTNSHAKIFEWFERNEKETNSKGADESVLTASPSNPDPTDDTQHSATPQLNRTPEVPRSYLARPGPSYQSPLHSNYRLPLYSIINPPAHPRYSIINPPTHPRYSIINPPTHLSDGFGNGAHSPSAYRTSPHTRQPHPIINDNPYNADELESNASTYEPSFKPLIPPSLLPPYDTDSQSVADPFNFPDEMGTQNTVPPYQSSEVGDPYSDSLGSEQNVNYTDHDQDDVSTSDEASETESEDDPSIVTVKSTGYWKLSEGNPVANHSHTKDTHPFIQRSLDKNKFPQPLMQKLTQAFRKKRK